MSRSLLHALSSIAVVCLAVAAAGLWGTARAAARAPMTGYLAEPVEQLALPGALASGEITPEGDIYTGWAEYQLSVGARLGPWVQKTRVLVSPALPLFRSRLVRQHVSYTQQVFTVPVDGQPVAYMSLTARDIGRRSETAEAALQLEYSRGPTITGFHGVSTGEYRYERPAPGSGDGYFFQLGATFDPDWSYSIQGRDVDRDGLLLARGPPGGVSVAIPGPPSPTAPQAEQAYRRQLAPAASVSWTWQIPLQPPPASAPADLALGALGLSGARARLADLWRQQERGMTQISVAERRVDSVYDANAMAILQSRYLTASGWVQGVNRLQYQSYWIRDSAIETVALDQIGLHTPAAQNLAFLAHWQQPDGLYISRAGQQDGIGQALWELAEHARLTRSAAFAASQLPNVGAAVNWIARASAQDAMGLLAPSTIGDDELLVDSRITGDNVWAATGLRSAVSLARLAGQPALAAAWQAIDDRFERALDSALRQAFAVTGHIPPGLDRPGGYDWGNYWTAYPLPILDPRGRMVGATVRWEQSHSREGLATYAGQLHDYLGFPIYETELERGDVAAALRGFYAELVHTTAPGFGWEDGPTAYGARDSVSNLAPHGTFAGQFVSMLRNLLVRDDGDAVDLLSGVSPAWMGPGDRISVRDAPTDDGVISLRLVVARSGTGATLHWSCGPRAIGSLFWSLPYWAVRARTPGGRPVGRRVRLRSRAGTVTLSWSGRRPRLSVDRAMAELDRGYRAHGRPSPIVPSPGW